MKKVYLLSIIMALLVGIAVYLFASSLQQQAQAQAVVQGKVVVAVADIPANTLITAEMVALVDLPKQSINPLAATTLNTVVGMINKYPLAKQEQILTPRLNKKGDSGEGELAYVLEEGQRAISMGVDDVAGVSGYITKGDYVDVVSNIILPGEDGSQGTPVSTILVENLLVLETGMKQLGSTDSSASTYKTITLSATPEQILKLNYAASNGTIRFVLRPVLDHEIIAPDDYPPTGTKTASSAETTAGTGSGS
ncbi:MAG: Flp pilus assembly protein CpaB [Clostridiaceae bacterium]|nr:Flp pilus assembly protein CpaB [Clostridiaceae bacterium]